MHVASSSLLLLAALAARLAAALPPVIVIPGLTSSYLLVRLSHFHSAYPWCKNSTLFWNLLWPPLDVDHKTPAEMLCWLELIHTPFNATAESFMAPAGVTVSTMDFGGFGGIIPTVLADIYTQQGWTVGKDLFCAPYDWRLPSSNLSAYYAQLQQLVESVHASTGHKVSLLSISLGPQITLGFLHRMSQSWRDTHIAWFVAESPAWTGTPTAVEMFVSGFGGGTNGTLLRSIAVGVGSSLWMFPRPGADNTTWSKDEVIVRTPARAYTAWDYADLVADLGFPSLGPAVAAALSESDLTRFDAPLVDTLVTYGFGLDTPGTFEYASPFVPNASSVPAPPSRIVNMSETGDTSVPVRSSLRSLVWGAAQAAAGKALVHRGFANMTHAACARPEGGECFRIVVDLLRTAAGA